MSFNSVGIIGLGLIGGCLAKGFAKNGVKLFGCDPSEKAITDAVESGIFEFVTSDIDGLLKQEPELIYVCVPVKTACGVFAELKAKKVSTAVTDACSTKKTLLEAAAGLNYCGGHPIAGREVSGFENSSSEIMRGAYQILTPQCDDFPLHKLKKLHFDIGMNVKVMTAEEHDKIFGMISHLPHITAFALVESVADFNMDAFTYTGGGFRDFTRIAASNPKMWTDIFEENSENMIEFIDNYIDILEKWKSMINEKKTTEIYNKIDEVSKIRRSI